MTFANADLYSGNAMRNRTTDPKMKIHGKKVTIKEMNILAFIFPLHLAINKEVFKINWDMITIATYKIVNLWFDFNFQK